MKAALVLNERPARTYGHDIEKLYADVVPLAPELLPTTLTVPEGVPPTIFALGDEPVDKFIQRLNFYGQPDNRYLFIGYVRRGSDIVKLDQLVFAVRRLCRPLPRVTSLAASSRTDPVSRSTRCVRLLWMMIHHRATFTPI